MSEDSNTPEDPTVDGVDSTDQDETGREETRDREATGDRGDEADLNEKADGEKKPAARKSGVEKSREQRERSAQAKNSSAAAKGVQVTITPRGVLMTVVALVLVAALVLLGVGGWKYKQQQDRLDAFHEAKAASEHFIKTYFETMFSPDVTTESLQAVTLPLTTGEARERVMEDADQTVGFSTESQVQNALVTPKSTSVRTFDATRAETVVAAQMKLTSPLKPEGETGALLFELSLVKKDGKWLVSQMGALQAVGGENQTQQQAPATGDDPAATPQPETEPQPGG